MTTFLDGPAMALRNEINQRAPQVKILRVGELFGKQTLDAIVDDRNGQHLWSVYARVLNPQPPEPAAAPLRGQLSLF